MPGWKKKAPGSWLDRLRSTDSAGIGKTAHIPLRVVAGHAAPFPTAFQGFEPPTGSLVPWRCTGERHGPCFVTGTFQALLPMRVQPLSLRVQVRDGLQV